ncbi:conserved hypothetical protein [Tenacibaculum piscium]|uniref:DUF1328 domain-containing protein n=2 Tax=Tenacibaculum piscium TaxID=1458515 RepID=A0A2H1YGT2_9FLAO|nr:conserved hypothetical protein [Tenacibaculum piscium]
MSKTYFRTSHNFVVHNKSALNQVLILKNKNMLRWTITFIIIALIAGVLGFGGIAGAAAGFAKIAFFIFLILFVISLFTGRKKI